MSDNTEFYSRIERHLKEARSLCRLYLDKPTNVDVLALLQQICLEQHRLVTVATKAKPQKRRGATLRPLPELPKH